MLKIDELNINNRKSMPYRKYFGEMDLPEADEKDRIEFAERFEDIITKMFRIVGLSALAGTLSSLDAGDLSDMFAKEYLGLCMDFGVYDEYAKKYTSDITRKLVDNTIKPILNAQKDADGTKDYTGSISLDRAMYVAENEANTILNYRDYQDAKRDGKTLKMWVDVHDGRERETHAIVAGSVVDIDEPFGVGTGLMMFPKDVSLGVSAEEIVGCRCHVKYM